jgi:hypothetical protein
MSYNWLQAGLVQGKFIGFQCFCKKCLRQNFYETLLNSALKIE